MTYEEESRKLLEKHKKDLQDILIKYQEIDNKYYEENKMILDGKPPSYKESEECKNQFNEELKKLKEKYNINTTL